MLILHSYMSRETPCSLFDIWQNCFSHTICKFDQSAFPGGMTAAVALGAMEPAVRMYNVIPLNGTDDICVRTILVSARAPVAE